MKRIAAWCAFLLPLAYVGMIVAVTVHEVLGHGLAAELYGGTFSGFRVDLDAMASAHAGASGHMVEVLAGGTVAQLLLAAVLVALGPLVRGRLLLRAALLVLALNLVLDGLPYGFWDAVYLGGRGDVSRIIERVEWAPLRPVLLATLGALYVVSVALICRMLFRTLEDDLGPLSLRAAAAIAGAMVLAVAAGTAAFDWNQLVPGADRVPTYASIGLQVAVGVGLVVTRRRHVVPRPVSVQAWAVGIPVASLLCALTVVSVLAWLREGVHW